MVALVFLPLAIALLGGAIGAAIGVVTAGVNFTFSRRAIGLPSTPSDLSWIKVDRRISCVAVDPRGVSLTGSIRDSGR